MHEEAEALAAAQRITETMNSDGWKLVRQIFEDQITVLSKIDGIASLKELQARQMAVRGMTNFLNDLDTIASHKGAFVQTQALKKVRDPIFKVLS